LLGFGVLVVVIEGSVKAAKDGEDSEGDERDDGGE